MSFYVIRKLKTFERVIISTLNNYDGLCCRAFHFIYKK